MYLLSFYFFFMPQPWLRRTGWCSVAEKKKKSYGKESISRPFVKVKSGGAPHPLFFIFSKSRLVANGELLCPIRATVKKEHREKIAEKGL